jgi:PAS domain S-box-containing protein
MRSARLRAQTEAHDSELQRDQLRVTLASIGDAVITADVRGCVTSMNPVAEQLTGWNWDEALGRPLGEVFRIIDEHTREPAPIPALEALRTGKITGLANHTLLLARHGGELPIDDSGAPIRDRDGGLQGVVLVFRDVSQRRIAERRLRRSEQELSDFFDNANVGMHQVGSDGIIVRANRAELEMLGYAREEYVGHPIAEFHEEREVAGDVLRRLTGGENLVAYPARMRCKDGSLKEVLINSSAAWDEHGRLLYTRCFTLDVTARNRAAQAQQLLAAVVESSEDAIVTKTLNGVITSWNAGAERLFGHTREEAVGKHITLIIPPERHPEEREILERVRRGEPIDHFETVRITRDGRRIHVSLRVSPIRDPEGRITGASKVARDITARVEAERALREADRRKDEFLATLAHELRNPLAPLRNSVELVRLAGAQPDVLAQVHATLERQTAQLERLVDDLLDIARISRDRLELRLQDTELASIVAQAVETCSAQARERGLELDISLPDEPIRLYADAARLAQVLSNLLSNACKYTDRGGHVWLRARRQGERVTIAVRDSGRGIPPEMLPRVFEMFTQLEPLADRSAGGLGIGLSLARRLVELHGGRIEAFSEGPGHGSEFVVHLPVDAPRSARAGQSAPPGWDGPVPRRRVLVVDDNVDAAEALVQLLRISGHDVLEAHDGETALKTAEAFRPDVVLLDIGLPRLSGHEVARRLREQPWGRTPLLVALTGWGQGEDRRKSREAGFDHHLVKPVDLGTLNALLATGLPRERVSPS